MWTTSQQALNAVENSRPPSLALRSVSVLVPLELRHKRNRLCRRSKPRISSREKWSRNKCRLKSVQSIVVWSSRWLLTTEQKSSLRFGSSAVLIKFTLEKIFSSLNGASTATIEFIEWRHRISHLLLLDRSINREQPTQQLTAENHKTTFQCFAAHLVYGNGWYDGWLMNNYGKVEAGVRRCVRVCHVNDFMCVVMMTEPHDESGIFE